MNGKKARDLRMIARAASEGDDVFYKLLYKNMKRHPELFV